MNTTVEMEAIELLNEELELDEKSEKNYTIPTNSINNN